MTVEDLNIRATIHCGALIDHLVQEGKADLADEGVKLLLERFKEVSRDFPPDRFPRYWDSTLEEQSSSQ